MDCLPAWHYQILEVRARGKALGQIHLPGCPQSLGELDDVPCKPEKMRARTEQIVQAGGWWSGPVTLTQYALARNIASEVGEGATPQEMVAVAEAAVNRQRYQPDKWPTIESQLLRNGQWFGKQRGQNPAASTSQDPYLVHLYVASLVLAGATGNFIRGGNVYLDAVTQDAVRARCLAKGKPKCATASRDVVANWTAGGESFWVGPLPGIDPRHMMIFVSGRPARASYREPGGHERWQRLRDAAFAALASTGPDERRLVYDLPPCSGAGPGSESFRRGAAILTAILGVAGATAASLYFAHVWGLSKPVPNRVRV